MCLDHLGRAAGLKTIQTGKASIECGPGENLEKGARCERQPSALISCVFFEDFAARPDSSGANVQKVMK
jgi:hypothetical protein